MVATDHTSDRDRLLRTAADMAVRYLAALDERSVAPTPEAVESLAQLHGPLPERPTDPLATLHALNEIVGRGTTATAGPRFYGLVAGGATPATLAAAWLAAAWDQPAAFHSVTPSVSELEIVALGWLLDLLGLPPHCAGSFVTGATMANTMGLAAARHAVLAGAGWNVEAEGLFGAPPITVVVGQEAHPSLFKSLGLLGLGRNRIITVPSDDQGRMRAELLPTLHPGEPAIVCTQVGNVNTGAFDPVGDVCRNLHGSGAWVHVDGAFGLWAAAAPSLSHLTAGMELADSWATDAHKWLNVPYDSGLAFVRDAQALRSAAAVTAQYLPTTGADRNPSDFTPEMSRRARGVEIWTALRTLGRSGVADLVERTCRLAARFADGLRQAGFEILNDVVINQVLVSFGDSQLTRRVIAGLQEEGTCWCGGTVWRGRAAMRISVSSWATTEDDVQRSLQAMIRVAEACRR